MSADRRYRLLADRPVAPGERWLYSAGFNVSQSGRDWRRVDAEVGGLSYLASRGARVAVLSHQGNYADGSAAPLDFVASYLDRTLPFPVSYFPGNASEAATARSHQIRPGEIVIFGNTRMNGGEERNDPGLARQFATLGDVVAVGGFAKAHRSHASNVGVLSYRPGFAAGSLADEVIKLAPWTDSEPGGFSAAFVGGRKTEKVTVGLDHLTRHYDLVVPGGVVLNCLLAASGYRTGGAYLGDEPAVCLRAAQTVLGRPNRAVLCLPEHVTIARREDGGYQDASTIPVGQGVPDSHEIVDFRLPPRVLRLLPRLAGNGRALLAGTLARYTDGFRETCDLVLAAMSEPGVRSVLLGGDTNAELAWPGLSSTGGGSALCLVATGTCAVLEALAANATSGPGRPEVTIS